MLRNCFTWTDARKKLSIFGFGSMVLVFPQIQDFDSLFWNLLQNFRSTIYASYTHSHTHTHPPFNCITLTPKTVASWLYVALKNSTIQIIFCIIENKSSLVIRRHIKWNSKNQDSAYFHSGCLFFSHLFLPMEQLGYPLPPGPDLLNTALQNTTISPTSCTDAGESSRFRPHSHFSC